MQKINNDFQNIVFNTIIYQSFVLVKLNNNRMLHLFKAKNYRKGNALLQRLSFTSEDFRQFHLDQIVSNIKEYEMLFSCFRQIMHDQKLSPLKSLKAVLICLQVFHHSKDNKVHQQIFQFLHDLQVRVHALLRAKNNKKSNDSIQRLSTSKDFLDKEQEFVAMDLSSILLGRIVIPLISFQEKLIVCGSLVYSKENYGCESEAEVWPHMNLLRKIADIGSDIESLGRYFFRESANAVICLMKVVNSDIQCIYKRIVQYFRRKILSIEIIFQEKKVAPAMIVQNQRLDEFLMMVQELEIINEKLRVIYNGRYFIHHLANNYVYLPVLFTEDEHLDLIYKIKNKTQQQKKNKPMNNFSKCKKDANLVQIVQDI